jgi:alanyl-tRNA synthetase
MLSSAEIREQFIHFFVKECGHTAVPSSPVVPLDDPTLLFTNAGMNQFKDVFLGLGTRPYKRAVDTQKCIRAGGKHNDLEDVGKDTYHHTFFEMLGNWSFGDYFKEDAIRWAWKLLTEVWGMDPKRLHATVFEGDKSQGIERDDEAAKLWREITSIPHGHIHLGNAKDNFWEMGETGPCGPCSEIHYDLTDDLSGAALVNKGSPLVVEIWNLVFIQFNRDHTKKLIPLPAKHVDTGMGFERVCAVLQGKKSNYDTDVFSPLFAAIQQVTGAATYGRSLTEPRDIAYRVIADHIRTLSFALADGAVPSNEGRGYVLRRILRRAVRYGRQTLGVNDPFFYRLVPVVAELMGGVFPELPKNQAAVADLIREEETLFGETLDRGIKYFNIVASGGSLSAAVDKSEHKPTSTISGEAAFTLYSTYGFPLDLTQLMAAEQGMAVDEEGFKACMDEAKELSRGGGGSADPRESLIDIVQQGKLPATNFLGYGSLHAESSLCAACGLREGRYEQVDTLAAGAKGAICFEATPFYAEAGGQVGDTGVIESKAFRFLVEETVKVGDIYFHLGSVEKGTLPNKGSMTLTVDATRRAAIMKHHTATHMLNHKLRAFLGEHVQQKGSLVDDQRLRFDFSHGQAISEAQATAIERAVNEDIGKNLVVYAEEVPQEEALKIHGLRAVFGEKYPPKVRVVSIGAPVTELLRDPGRKDWYDFSVEFCGGTHLTRTGEAGKLVLVGEEAVAKGVRRVTAVAGERAERALEEGKSLLSSLQSLAQKTAEVLEKELPPIIEETAAKVLSLKDRASARELIAQLQKKSKEHHKEQSRQAMGQIVEVAREIAEQQSGPIIVASVGDADADALRTAMDVIHGNRPAAALLLGAAAGGKVSFVARVPEELIKLGLKAGEWVKSAATVAGGGGGGRPDMAQAGGKDPSKLDEALEAARAFASGKLPS